MEEITNRPNIGKFIIRIATTITFVLYGLEILQATIKEETASNFFIGFIILIYFLAPLGVIIGLFTRFLSLVAALGCIGIFLTTNTAAISVNDLKLIAIHFASFISLVFFGSGSILALKAD